MFFKAQLTTCPSLTLMRSVIQMLPNMPSFFLIISLTHTQCWQSGVRTTDYTISSYVSLCLLSSFPYCPSSLSRRAALSLSSRSLIYVLQLNLLQHSPAAWLQFPLSRYHQIRGESLVSWCFSSHAHTHTHAGMHTAATQQADRCAGTIKQFVMEVIWFKILSIRLDRPVRCVYMCVGDKTMKMAERI